MARALLLAGVQQWLTTPGMLRTALSTRGPCRRRSLIGESLDDAEGGIASVPEWDFSDLVRRRGLPQPTR